MRGLIEMQRLLVCVACAACGASAPTDECAGDSYDEPVKTVSVARLPGTRPFVWFDGLSRKLELVLYYNGDFPTAASASPPISDGNDWYCAQLSPDASATIDGLALATYRGGWGCFGPTGPGCISPSFSGNVPADFAPPDPSIVVTDYSTKYDVGIGDILVPRMATPIGNSDWNFFSGQTVTLTWSPAPDLALSDAEVEFTTAGSGFIIDSGFVRGSNTLSFTLPSSPTGSGTMRVTLRGFVGPSLWVSQVVEHSATVQ